MSEIHLTTFIKAPAERIFDLSRSIDLHKISTAHTNEKAVAGTTSGLIKLNETVTWQAQHLFKLREFTSRITVMEKPVYFVDEMIKGDFKSFMHLHQFKPGENGCWMIDKIAFESPFGIIGKLANQLFLKNYLQKLLMDRNAVIKQYAESQQWKAILN